MPLGLVCKVAAISASRWDRSYCGLRTRLACVSQTVSIPASRTRPRRSGQDQPTPQRDLLRRAVGRLPLAATAFDPQPTIPLLDWFSPYPES